MDTASQLLILQSHETLKDEFLQSIPYIVPRGGTCHFAIRCAACLYNYVDNLGDGDHVYCGWCRAFLVGVNCRNILKNASRGTVIPSVPEHINAMKMAGYRNTIKIAIMTVISAPRQRRDNWSWCACCVINETTHDDIYGEMCIWCMNMVPGLVKRVRETIMCVYAMPNMNTREILPRDCCNLIISMYVAVLVAYPNPNLFPQISHILAVACSLPKS